MRFKWGHPTVPILNGDTRLSPFNKLSVFEAGDTAHIDLLINVSENRDLTGLIKTYVPLR
jgi:hypothetical protein